MSSPEHEPGRGLSRRTLLKAAGASAGLAATAAALSPLTRLQELTSVQAFLQKHYKELTPDEKQAVLRRLEAEQQARYGRAVTVAAPAPLPATRFGYALNLSVCAGCRQCAEACHRENNHDRPTRTTYISVFEIAPGTMDLSQATTDYHHPVPDYPKTYMPIQCQQCSKPSCVNVCPTRATWKEPDGLVVVDYDWCIGCRYCEAACPYHARRFNWAPPEIPAAELNPAQAYLSNRPRPSGCMEKCTFCLHRTRVGRLPACLEACPAGARVFGNLLDPESEIRRVLAEKRVFILKEELGTAPSFFYFFSV